MPELPEIESLRRALNRHVRGARIREVQVRRPDIIHGPSTRPALLRGRRIAAFDRHGKQLAMIAHGPPARPAPCVCFHLGMSGTIILHESDPEHRSPLPHTHVVWTLEDGREIHHRDPRRFGGIWTYRDRKELEERRWSVLGPDAMTVTAQELHRRLQSTQRALKAALLDQRCLAGLGNIYVDELLFRCRLHPLKRGGELSQRATRNLVEEMRSLLASAVRAGGSTFRDHRNANGRPGGFQAGHRVYGRGGETCHGCRRPLATIQIVARTTVFCPRCQRG